MATLTEFLKSEGREHLNEIEGADEMRKEWLAALGRLMEQLRQWLAEADPDGVLEVVPREYELIEARLGRYLAPGLVLRLGARQVEVKPGLRTGSSLPGPGPYKERLAAGRVELANDLRTYVLYRKRDETGEKWLIANPEKSAVK